MSAHRFAADTTTLEGCALQAARLGCELITTRIVAGSSPGRVLLCRREEDDAWITWRTYDNGCRGFYHGHYDLTEDEARADLAARL